MRQNRKGGERLKQQCGRRASRVAAAPAGDTMNTNFSSQAHQAAHQTQHEFPEPEAKAESAATDPFEVVDEPAPQVIDAMADAMVERQLREWEAEADEADENEADEPCGYEEYSELPTRTPKEPQIKVVVFSPDDWPRVTLIDNTLSSLQRVVGGLIEVFPVGIDGVIGVCNENFIAEDLPRNRFIRATQSVICGTFFVAGDGVNFASLSERQIKDVFLNL